MSLNDNVLDDIYSGDVSLLDDNETSMKTVGENIISIIKNSPNPSTDPLLNRVVGADINLVSLVDGFNDLCEKKDMQKDILSVENISRNDALLIHNVFGNLLSEKLSLEEFTTFNSKTNYSYILRYMNTTISKEEESFINNRKVFLNETLDDVKVVLEKIKEEYVIKILETVGDLKSNYGDIYNNLTSNKDLVIPYNDGFNNITTINLSELDPSLIKLAITNKGSFIKTISLFRQLIDVKEVNVFIGSMSTFSTDILYKENSGLQPLSINILDLAKLVQECDIEKLILDLDKTIQGLISSIDTIKKDHTHDLTDFELIKENHLDMKIVSTEVIIRAGRIVSLMTNLPTLFETVNDLFEYTKQF